MITAVTESAYRSKSVKTDFFGDFFIVKKLPFVGYKNTLKLPFVGCKYPLDRNGGFTVIEMIITMLVVAILASVAIPQMRALFQNNRLTTQTNSLISDITMARDQAMGRAVVVICTSTTGAVCDGSGWGSGRLMFVDSAPNNFTFDPGTDRVLRFTDPLPAGSIEVTRTVGDYAHRHRMKPGMTGWAQVNGRNTVSWPQKFAYDVWYVDHISFGLDIKILLLTVMKVFKAEGISSDTSVTMEKFHGNH